MKFEHLQRISIDEFPLKWRWKDSNYFLMPEQDLIKVVPLSEQSSEIVFQMAVEHIKKSEIENSSDKINTSAERAKVTAFLQARVPETQIVINWGSDTSVVTNSLIFIKYWDNFCYPSSDDVSIWSQDETWLLQYFHYEVFSFVAM